MTPQAADITVKISIPDLQLIATPRDLRFLGTPTQYSKVGFIFCFYFLWGGPAAARTTG